MNQHRPDATIRELRDRLSDLIDHGLGDHPIDLLVVPEATLEALVAMGGQTLGDGPKPVVVELFSGDDRGPVIVISPQDEEPTNAKTLVQ